jgi:lantibiotic biosynthesis protein
VQSRERRWSPVLAPDEVPRALALARDVAVRLSNGNRMSRAVLASQRSHGSPSRDWQAHGVARGYAGLALLWGSAAACMPGEAWDLVGHDQLRRAAQAAERQVHVDHSMFSGLGGLAFASWYLSRQGERYRKALRSIDAALLSLVTTATVSFSKGNHHGVSVSTFDVISGLAGVGRYLLLRSGEDSHRVALEGVLRFLVSLTVEQDGIPHWHTPPRFLAGATIQDAYPQGNLNCGLAHGIPGPLALLSLATRHGITVEGQTEAIRRVAEWLCQHSFEDQWGLNWPNAVPLGLPASPHGATQSVSGKLKPSRTAWCYGSPGIARSLWLAGDATGEAVFRNTAIGAMEAVYRRPLRARQIDSPTFCHGVAGLQQITLRFAHDTGLPLFADAACALHRQMIDAYEPESTWGYRNLEPNGDLVDRPGVLDGAAGVALVLLAAATSTEPLWDSVFLLS